MLKVVVYDCGYGGEFFADRLAEELPIVEIIRVIDWRHATEIQNNPRDARRFAKEALRPYIGKVDLIIFANYLLAITSLKHFRRKYKTQRFTGLTLKKPCAKTRPNSLVLTTKAVSRTISYYNFTRHFDDKPRTVALDSWPLLIDDGELTYDDIKLALFNYVDRASKSQDLFLLCSQFYDIKSELKRLFGHNVKIHDGFKDTIKDICRILKIRGGTLKKSR